MCVCCGNILDLAEECHVCGIRPLCATCHPRGEHNCPGVRLYRADGRQPAGSETLPDEDVEREEGGSVTEPEEGGVSCGTVE